MSVDVNKPKKERKALAWLEKAAEGPPFKHGWLASSTPFPKIWTAFAVKKSEPVTFPDIVLIFMQSNDVIAVGDHRNEIRVLHEYKQDILDDVIAIPERVVSVRDRALVIPADLYSKYVEEAEIPEELILSVQNERFVVFIGNRDCEMNVFNHLTEIRKRK